MRRTENSKWIYTKGDTTALDDLMGLGCGSDMCAEHECGVLRIQTELGCDGAKDGIGRRTISVLPDESVKWGSKLGAFSGRKFDALIFATTYGEPLEQKLKDRMTDELRQRESFKSKSYSYEAPALYAAWDETSFGVVAYGKKSDPDRARVRALWEAFQRKDVALWTNVGVFHLGMGLMFVIVSKVPDNLKQTMLDSDLSQKRLAQKVAEVGIEEELTKAGKRWFALSPRWTDDKETDVKFWLNPMEQRAYNAGWWSVDELRQWAKDTGPVIKGAQVAR